MVLTQRTLGLFLLVSAASMASLTACGDGAASTGAGGGGISDEHEQHGLDDVVYVGGATDEALHDMLDAVDLGQAKSDPARRASFTSPEAGAGLGAEPPTFAWRIGGEQASRPRAPRPWSPASPAPLEPASARDGLASRALAGALKVLLAPVPEARAHGAPFSGTGAFLVITSTSSSAPLRVFTSGPEFTPTAAQWSALAGDATAGSITATLTTCDFEENRILQGGGPFVGGSVTVALGGGT